MSDPLFHGKMPRASAILEAFGTDLLKIKMEDGLTWAGVGETLGKSEDQAAKYASGDATIDLIAYTRARVEWNGRITGGVDALVKKAGGHIDGQHSQTLILKAAFNLSAALEDGALTDAEILANRKSLEDAKAAIEKLLCRVALKAVS